MRRTKEKIDIMLLTFNRKRMLQQTLEGIWERTKTPYRLVIVDAGSNDGTIRFLKRLKSKNRIDEVILMKDNPGLCACYNEAFKYIKSELFIMTQDDLIPPDSEPDWLQSMIDIFERNPDHGAVAMRVARMINTKFTGDCEIGYAKRACSAYYRIQRKSLFEKVPECLGRRRWNEDIEFKKIVSRYDLKAGFARDIWANHIGHSQKPNKGYAEDFINYEGHDERKNKEKQRKPYPQVDNKTNIPI